jgi:hypothetical protein
VLLPHYPYVFTADCDLKPTAEWKNRNADPDPDTPDTRADRYRLYMQQVQCSQRLLFKFMDALGQNEWFREATVLVHGDHGSRISLQGETGADGVGELAQSNDRDWHGSLIALRHPGSAGARIDRPVVLDELFSQLLKNDFAGIDVEGVAAASAKSGAMQVALAASVANPCTASQPSPIELTGPFVNQSRNAFVANLSVLKDESDTSVTPRRSTVWLCEDGKPLGPRHSTHDHIRGVGRGAFSHWQDYVLFSSSDGSSPNENGRRYTIVRPQAQPTMPNATRERSTEAVVDNPCTLLQGMAIELKGPFVSQPKNAFVANLPTLKDVSDSSATPRRSAVWLCEDGKPLGPSHSVHDHIRDVGRGAFSHWQDYVLFSSSDGTSPNENGRRYTIVSPQ